VTARRRPVAIATRTPRIAASMRRGTCRHRNAMTLYDAAFATTEPGMRKTSYRTALTATYADGRGFAATAILAAIVKGLRLVWLGATRLKADSRYCNRGSGLPRHCLRPTNGDPESFRQDRLRNMSMEPSSRNRAGQPFVRIGVASR